MNDLLQDFSFQLPTRIEYGIGSLSRLNSLLQDLNITRAIIVTDQGIIDAGLIDKVVKPLKAAKIKHIIFNEVEANPKDYNVENGAKLAESFGAEAIIALGGGSPIDCAKAIGVLLSHPGEKIQLYEGKTAVTNKIMPLIAIPTTAGTGSEITFSAVITDTTRNYKMTIKSPLMAPRIALLDPKLTLTLPPQVTASTGLDALTHAIEGYTVKSAEPISNAVALEAVKLIYSNLSRAVHNGTDIRARAGMLMGSLLAGLAFSHADVGSVHCMAEALGGIYDAPHGVCNSILLPYVMEYNLKASTDKYARIAEIMGQSFTDNLSGAKKAIKAIKELSADVELPSFKSLDVNPADFQLLARMAASNISTESNPREIAENDYLELFKQAYSN